MKYGHIKTRLDELKEDGSYYKINVIGNREGWNFIESKDE